jgi:hypothetical protein
MYIFINTLFIFIHNVHISYLKFLYDDVGARGGTVVEWRGRKEKKGGKERGHCRLVV